MFRIKDLSTFEQLDDLMGKDEIVTHVNGRYRELTNPQLYALWRSARERLKSNGLSSSCYPNPKSAIPDVVSAIEIACARKQFNIRRDEMIEPSVKRELEKTDYETICNCAKLCEPEIKPEEVEEFRRIRSFYRELKRFVKKFKSKGEEYRWDYESAKIQYRKSKRHLISHICNYLMHPRKSDGEYVACKNDEEIQIIRKKHRSKILRIKEKVTKFIRREPSLYKSVIENDENLNYQDIHQGAEPEDLSLIKTVMSRVCSHDDHDFTECPNLKEIKKALNHSLSSYPMH